MLQQCLHALPINHSLTLHSKCHHIDLQTSPSQEAGLPSCSRREEEERGSGDQPTLRFLCNDCKKEN